MGDEGATCPRCFSALDGPRAIEQSLVWVCARCGGALVDTPLSAVGRAVTAHLAEVEASDLHKVAASRPAGPCPICRKFMTPTPVRVANVTIDVCERHGAWYDRGELEAVVRSRLRASVDAPPRAATPPTEVEDAAWTFRVTPEQKPKPAPARAEKLALFQCVIEPDGRAERRGMKDDAFYLLNLFLRDD